MAYFQRENAELVNLSGCELIESQFACSPITRGLALDYFTEVAEQLLPAHEPNEKFFRLLVAVLAYLREGGRSLGRRFLLQPLGRAPRRRSSGDARQR